MKMRVLLTLQSLLLALQACDIPDPRWHSENVLVEDTTWRPEKVSGRCTKPDYVLTTYNGNGVQSTSYPQPWDAEQLIKNNPDWAYVLWRDECEHIHYAKQFNGEWKQFAKWNHGSCTNSHEADFKQACRVFYDDIAQSCAYEARKGALPRESCVHIQEPLSYGAADLSPGLSEALVDSHYNGHHQGYVDQVNALIKGTQWETRTLEDIIKNAAPGPLLEAASQVYNHDAYWQSMRKFGSQDAYPNGQIVHAIRKDFENVGDLREKFLATAKRHFGSGWVWLVQKKSGKLAIKTTLNGGNPLRPDGSKAASDQPCWAGSKTIFVVDIWEHAYYSDYGQDRARYLENWWDNLLDWENANNNLDYTLPELFF